LLANVVAWFAVLRQVAQALQTNMAGAFPWKPWLRTIATSALAAALAVAVTRGSGPTVVLIVARLGVFAGALAVAEFARRQLRAVRFDTGEPA
jgi:hypothetical protein